LPPVHETTLPRTTSILRPEDRILLAEIFSAILLHILAVRPVHEYNVTMGGVMPQVDVLSKLAMSDQRHDGITRWHSSQVEGLVPVKGVQVQVLSPAAFRATT